MSEISLPRLPAQWQWVSLGSLLDGIDAGKSFTCDERPPTESEYGIVKVSAVTWGTYDESESKTITDAARVDLRYLIEPGDLLFSRANTLPLVGAAVIVHETRRRLLLSDKILRLRLSDDIKGWVSRLLKSHLGRSQIEALSTGNQESMRNIGQERIRQIQVPIAPAGEMRRIESKIDELFSRIEEGERALERVQKLVERYRQSVLKAAVTGDLTRAWREQRKGQLESGEALLARILKARREAWEQSEFDKVKGKGIQPANDKWKQKYEEPTKPNTSDLPTLPEGWTWASLSQLSWASNYGTSVKCAYGATGVPVLRIPNIRAGRFDFDDIKSAASDLALDSRDRLARGDLLVVRTNGSENIIGVGSVFSVEPPFASYFASYLIRFRLVLPGELSEWVNLAWQSHVVREFIAERKATSAGQYNVSQSSLRELCLPIPGTQERLEIVDVMLQALSRSDNSLQSVIAQTHLSSALRQSVLKGAFDGSLVGQDATDEPASVLLERISAERDGIAHPAGRRLSRRSIA